MLSVAEAAARITAGIVPLPPERVPLLDAVGRVLAEDAVAAYTMPPWTNSAMDGYAVRAVDIAGASASAPVRLRVLETVAAGAFPTRPVGAGEATRIMTGAPVPEGCDTVVRVEDTDDGTETVEVREVPPKEFMRLLMGGEMTSQTAMTTSYLAAKRLGWISENV